MNALCSQPTVISNAFLGWFSLCPHICLKSLKTPYPLQRLLFTQHQHQDHLRPHIAPHTRGISRRTHNTAPRSPPPLQRQDSLHSHEHGHDHDAAGGATLPRREVRDRTDVPQDADAAPVRAPRVRQQVRGGQARSLAPVHALDGRLLVRYRRGVPGPRYVCSGRAVARPERPGTTVR